MSVQTSTYKRTSFSLFAYCRWCKRYMMYASDEGWGEFFLTDINLCLNLVMHCNSAKLLFEFLTAKFNFSRISSERLDLRSLFKYFLFLWSQKGGILSQVLLDKFCPLHEFANHKLTTAGVWPGCRIETNLFCSTVSVLAPMYPYP
jgi:hypothetical protein